MIKLIINTILGTLMFLLGVSSFYSFYNIEFKAEQNYINTKLSAQKSFTKDLANNNRGHSHYRQSKNEYKDAIKSTVKLIVVDKESQKQIGQGTAFHVGDGLFLTVDHNFLEDDDNSKYSYFIEYQGGYFEIYKLRGNKNIDIASFIVYDHMFKKTLVPEYHIELCDSDVLIGDDIYSFGYGIPFINDGSLKKGFQNTNSRAFSLEGIHLSNRNSISHLNINVGDSGSAILKEGEGCYFGIVNGVSLSMSSVMSYVSYGEVKTFLDETYLFIESLKNGENNG